MGFEIMLVSNNLNNILIIFKFWTIGEMGSQIFLLKSECEAIKPLVSENFLFEIKLIFKAWKI
jgi:hypothetical protein